MCASTHGPKLSHQTRQASWGVFARTPSSLPCEEDDEIAASFNSRFLRMGIAFDTVSDASGTLRSSKRVDLDISDPALTNAVAGSARSVFIQRLGEPRALSPQERDALQGGAIELLREPKTAAQAA